MKNIRAEFRRQDPPWRHDPGTGAAPAPPRARKHSTREWLQAGVTVGLLLIVAWFLLDKTTILIAYRGGPLATVRGMCDGSFGYLARSMNASAGARCRGVDSLSGWVQAAGVAGVLLAAGCGLALVTAFRGPAPPRR